MKARQAQQLLSQADKALKRLEVLRPEDAKVAREFVSWLKTRGVKERRLLKYASQLRKLSDWLGKPFDEASKQDINELAVKIRDSDLAQSYKYDLLLNIRYFYKWRQGDGKRYPELVDDIILKHPRPETLNPNKLLSSEDVDALIRTTSDLQLKALLACLYATGARVGEMLNLNYADVFTVSDGTHGFILNGKTGERRIPMKEPRAERFLSQWLEAHPQKQGALWLNEYNKPLSYQILHRRFTRLIETANFDKLGKRRLFHWFRHSRATELGKHLQDGPMKYYFGWTQGSDMLNRYRHADESYVENALTALYPQDAVKAETMELAQWLELQKKLFEHKEFFDFFFNKAHELGYIDDRGKIMPNVFIENGSAAGVI